MSIHTLQEALKDMEQVDCPVFHHFTDGIYARETVMPQGACMVGATHKTNHFFMVVKGECYITSGDKTIHVTGPYLTQTTPGTKRAFMAITDTVLMTFHATEETDPLKIAEDILVPEGDYLPQWKRLGGVK